MIDVSFFGLVSLNIILYLLGTIIIICSPALVKSESESEALVEVSFAELGKSLGVFKWPSGKDIHKVARASIISTKVDIQPRAGGWLWEVTDAHKIDEKYKRLQ